MHEKEKVPNKNFPINEGRHLVILDSVRESTGLNIKDWANDIGISRITVYRSAEGDGSRRIRVMLAQMMGMKPSEIWPSEICPQRGKIRQNRDDAAYYRSLKENP